MPLVFWGMPGRRSIYEIAAWRHDPKKRHPDHDVAAKEGLRFCGTTACHGLR